MLHTNLATFLITVKLKKKINTQEDWSVLDLNFEVSPHQIIGLFGKSGVGKTMTLRMLAGLSKPDEGYIRMPQELWFDSKTKVNQRIQDRSLGFVFQDYALFPHLTVYQNLRFALPPKAPAKIIGELLEIAELSNLAHYRPHQLSGGQQQRVALARALVRQPELLLLDEPLSALDYEIRLRLQELIRTVQQHYNSTIFLVSHDIDEVRHLAKEVLVLEKGQVSQQGPPQQVFRFKGTREVWERR